MQDPDIFMAYAANDMRCLLTALEKYGGHNIGCPADGFLDRNEYPCTCGWDALNKTPEKEDV